VDPLLGERRDQLRLVDHRAAADIDDDAARPERIEHGAVDQLVGRGAARQHADQHVDIARHLHEIAIVAIGDILLRTAVVIDDRHAERLQPAGDRLADPAEPDNASRAVAKRRLGQRIGRRRPLSGPQIALGGGEFAHCHQDQAERGVGHFLGEHVRRVGDDHALLGGVARIDIVVADAEIRDDLEMRQRIDQRGVHFRMATGGDGADMRRERRERGGRIVAQMQAVHGELRVQRPLDAVAHASGHQDFGP